MTQQDKDILLEKMLDPGSVLTEAEIDVILSDEELRELYDISSVLRGACVQPSVVDVEQEWRLFRHKLHPKPSRWRWAMRVAAIFLGVLFVSSTLKVAIDRMMTDDIPSLHSSKTVPSSNVASTLRARPGTSEVISSMCSSESGLSSNVASTLRVRPGASEPKPIKKAPKISVPTLTRVEEKDVDEYLRLEQARIDNDLALLQAQLYIDEVQALSEAELPSDDGEISYGEEIRYVIMQ